MSILALGRKHKKKRKFPNQEREKTQKKIPNERVGESKNERKEVKTQHISLRVSKTRVQTKALESNSQQARERVGYQSLID